MMGGPGQPGPFRKMRQVLDYDPLSGQTVVWDSDMASGRVTITHSQDVSSNLSHAAAMRSATGRDRKGIRDDMWHYAHVPNVVIMEMKQKHGVDFFNRNDWPAVFKLLNDEYSQFKTTDKHHSIKHA